MAVVLMGRRKDRLYFESVEGALARQQLNLYKIKTHFKYLVCKIKAKYLVTQLVSQVTGYK